MSVALAKGFQGKDDQFFTKGLEVEMGYEGACEAAIFPDTVRSPPASGQVPEHSRRTHTHASLRELSGWKLPAHNA